MILAIKTDQPQAELYLFGTDSSEVDREVWEAGRALSQQILARIQELLARNNKQIEDLTGIVVFKGPGSFTGLRIGISVANTLAYGNNIPVIGAKSDNWITQGLNELAAGAKPGQVVLPDYGAGPNITQQKK